jgi:hypothetical protein
VRIALAVVLVLAASTTSVVRAQGRTLELDLAHGAVIRDDAPEAIAHVPAGIDASQPIALVILLHGYSGCTRVLASDAPDARCRPRDPPEQGFGWAAAHEAAGTRSILLIPQLAWRARDGSPGRFGIAGEAARFVDEALGALAPQLGGTPTVSSITIAAHSAGFETTLAILRHGGLEVRNVVLFDALYSGVPSFLDWVAAGTDAAPRTLVSLATGGRTWTRTEGLARDARRRATVLRADAWPATLPSAPRIVATAHVHIPHHDVPVRTLADTLRALGLPVR